MDANLADDDSTVAGQDGSLVAMNWRLFNNALTDWEVLRDVGIFLGLAESF